MYAVVDEAELFVAVVLDGVVFVEVDHVVVGPVERELFNVFARSVSGNEGGVEACALAVLDAALVCVGFAVGLGNVAFGAETVLFEVGPASSLVLADFVPLPQIGRLVVAIGGRRSFARLAHTHHHQ